MPQACGWQESANEWAEGAKALGIAGVQTETSSWRHAPMNSQDRGAQIDLGIDRRSGVINLCEMKFGEDHFVIEATEQPAADRTHCRASCGGVHGG
jgi:hypothetical protein